MSSLQEAKRATFKAGHSAATSNSQANQPHITPNMNKYSHPAPFSNPSPNILVKILLVFCQRSDRQALLPQDEKVSEKKCCLNEYWLSGVYLYSKNLYHFTKLISTLLFDCYQENILAILQKSNPPSRTGTK